MAAPQARFLNDQVGNRVQETVAGVTTKYLVGEMNPTGYAQVFAELSGTNSLLRAYEWGLQLEAVRDFTVNSFGIFHYYGHDGHGSVRWLTNASGVITDTYDYDAFGNLISSTGATFNNYLFAGEQFDPALGIYYNRARYYDQRQGRFWSMDALEASGGDPAAIHKYTYAHNDPTNRRDPSGYATAVEEIEVVAEQNVETAIAIANPAIAGGGVALAQTAATVSQVQVALYWILQTALFAGPFLAAVLPSPSTPKNDDGEEPGNHRGRLQVQGTDILRQRYDLSNHRDFKYDKDTLSWGWNEPTPLGAATAASKLSEFLQILTYEQIGRRAKAFSEASQFIIRASLGGGVGPPGNSFPGHNDGYSGVRVDIEISKGLAFIGLH